MAQYQQEMLLWTLTMSRAAMCPESESVTLSSLRLSPPELSSPQQIRGSCE